MTDTTPRIEVREVTCRFGATVAVNRASMTVARGECVALVGESGSGKTTLLRTLNRLVEPASGEVLLDGTPVRERDPILLRRAYGYVMQHGGLLPHWTVGRNVGLVPSLSGREASPGVDDLLAHVGLDPTTYRDRWPRSLSGGERQRVALARALAHKPEALLLDEPFGALDALTRSELQRTFRRLVEEDGLTAVLVTHDLEEARRIADRIYVLREGGVMGEGTFSALAAHPTDSYVGRLFARAGVRS